MFRNRKNNVVFRAPESFREPIVEEISTEGGVLSNLSFGYRSKKIPTPDKYRLSALLASGTVLSPVSVDITPLDESLKCADKFFTESSKAE